MRLNIVSLFFIIAVVFFYSCKQEGCTDPLALNYNPEAEVDDCSCIYPPEDTTPQPDIRDPYVGDYQIRDSLFMMGDFSEAKNYTLTIDYGNTVSDTIFLRNFWGDGDDYFAILTDSSFTFPSQQVSGPYYAEGSGEISNGVISYETSGDVYINRGVGNKN
ncbi:MAG: hypothetical protein C0596_05435 [Marinilabiliales bacterium]|nr:MAG: hypothetical protein C0596_05435 [Marinilabiliales bacterium]